MHDFLVTPMLCEEVERNRDFERPWREVNRNNGTLCWLSMRALRIFGTVNRTKIYGAPKRVDSSSAGSWAVSFELKWAPKVDVINLFRARSLKIYHF